MKIEVKFVRVKLIHSGLSTMEFFTLLISRVVASLTQQILTDHQNNSGQVKPKTKIVEQDTSSLKGPSHHNVLLNVL